MDGLGSNPSPFTAIAYCVATLSLFGLSFGIIWARTKNLIALILVHAATDLMPNLTEFVRNWNIR